MRIQSSFSDYYDKIQAFGIDSSCVYNRKTAKKYISLEHPFISRLHDQGFYDWRFNSKKYGAYEYIECNQFILGHSGKFIREYSLDLVYFSYCLSVQNLTNQWLM